MRMTIAAILSITAVFILAVNARICPDGTSECDDAATCCLIGRGVYGCCPMPDAVCCNDHLHCCPQNTTCDVEAERCISMSGDGWRRMRRKQQARKLNTRNNILCPDHETKCDDDSTCCIIGSHQYGCCPLPNAVCCSDHLHCCPEGTKCDLKHGMCLKHGRKVVAWSNKQHKTKQTHTPSFASKMSFKMCAHSAKCPASNECCQTEDGHATCCAHKDGVCCDRGRSCCPSGFRCEEDECIHEDYETIEMKQPTATIRALENIEDHPTRCGDGSFCASMNRCCPARDISGKILSYGCCKGVCCGNNCCSHGYRCVGGNSCVRNTKKSTRKFYDLFAPF